MPCSKDEVSAEAFKSLYGTTRKNDVDLSMDKSKSKIVTPSFEEITNFVYSEAEQIMKSNKSVSSGNHTIPFSVPVYTEVIRLLLNFFDTSK